MEGKDIRDILADPSVLTTAQLQREIASLEKYLLARIESIERDIKKTHEDAVRVPTEIQKQVGALKELLIEKIDGKVNDLDTKILNTNKLKEEKFLKVEQRFDLIEKQRIEQKADTSKAVENALASSRELFTLQNENFTKQIAQLNESFTKQIDAQGFSISNITKALDERINDNKDKIIRIESIAAGALNQKVSTQTEKTSNVNLIAFIIGTLIAIVGIIIGVVMAK